MTLLPNALIEKHIPLQGGGDVVLVTQECKGTLDPARNIYLLDESNNVLWQVEPATVSHGVVGFANIYLGQNNELLAYSKNGIEYQIDVSTGAILGKELIR